MKGEGIIIRGLEIRDRKRKEGEQRNEKRRSKDKVINVEEWKLLNFLREEGWSILNGNARGDE